MVLWWCPDEALIRPLWGPEWWCTDDALMMHWCTDDALIMHWWCAVVALMMPWWCPDYALMMPWWCHDDALTMFWWCTDDALMMPWWCTEYDMMHIGQVSDSYLRFYGGRINGDKTWRQPTTDNRQGEYRAICLWKMDWQSFAILSMSIDCGST